MVVPTSVDHWPTGVSYTPSLVNADVPHIGPVYAGPDCFDTCSYVRRPGYGRDGGSALRRRSSLPDISDICLNLQDPFAAGMVARAHLRTKVLRGSSAAERATWDGRVRLTHHRTPFQPRSTIRPPLVALVCSTWREAWDEAQTVWVRRPSVPC